MSNSCVLLSLSLFCVLSLYKDPSAQTNINTLPKSLSSFFAVMFSMNCRLLGNSGSVGFTCIERYLDLVREVM